MLILGQDPYHKAGQAHGLSFSVRDGRVGPAVAAQRLQGATRRTSVCRRRPRRPDRLGGPGVLLLNAVLTVRASKAGSHASKGWEQFTDAAIRALDDQPTRVVFVLWGGYARRRPTW